MTLASGLLKKIDSLIDAHDAGHELLEHDVLIKNRWRADPYRWARERLRLNLCRWASYAPALYKTHQWDGTVEPLHTAAKALASGNSVAISSATGVGKTYLGAVIVLWWLDCWEGSQVITMAPKEAQLTLHIWKEIGILWPLFKKLHPKAQLQSLEIRMRPFRKDWGAVGFACGVAAEEAVAGRARGFHAKDMLFIFEETPSVHPAILEAVALTCVAPHNLRVFFGNPDSALDSLARVSAEPGIIASRASALDHPNVLTGDASLIPGAQSLKVINEWRLKYGDGLAALEIDDPIFMSRARGIVPGQSQFSLIRLEWLLAAIERARDDAWAMKAQVGHAALGFDVAGSEDGDWAATVFGRGAIAIEVKKYRCPDANEWARHHVWPIIQSGLVAQRNVGGDPIGVGHGAFKELKRLGAGEVRELTGSAAPLETYNKDEKFRNLRCQMYWQARMDLQAGNVGIAISDSELRAELLKDLTAPTWSPRNGKIEVEAKEKYGGRLGRSPDVGDAFVYWNWMRQVNALTFDVASKPVSF